MSVPRIWQETLDSSREVDGGVSLRSAITLTPATPLTDRQRSSQSASWSSSLPLRVISRQDVADYFLQGVLGQGGMGVVYSARQRSLQRDVAVKIQRRALPADSPQGRHFLAEALVTGGLSHPNIVPVLEIGLNDDESLFYSMQQVQGRSWAEILKEQGDERGRHFEEHLRIFQSVAQAVACAHAAGIIHCDLKPANVMVGEQGQVFVVDWGLAMRRVGSADDDDVGGAADYAPLTPGGIGGTPAYMAPEQARHDLTALSPQTDIYLLGAILFQLCAGKPPHGGRTAHDCLEAALANRIRASESTHPLMTVARQALADDPDERPRDVSALLTAIRTSRQRQLAADLSHSADILAQGGEPDRYARATAVLHQAQAMVAEVPACDLQERLRQQVTRIRHEQAGDALRRGDPALTLDLLADEADHPLARQARAAQDQDHYWQQQRVRWRRGLTTIAIAAIVLIGLFSFLAEGSAEQAVAEAQRAEIRAMAAAQARAEAAESADRLERQQAASACLIAGDALQGFNLPQARMVLVTVPEHLRGWTWRYLWRQADQPAHFVPVALGRVTGAACTPDGTMALVSSDRGLTAIDIERTTIAWQITDQPLQWVGCHPDGTIYVAGDRIWRVAGRQLQAMTSPVNGGIEMVAIGPDHGLVGAQHRRFWYWHEGQRQVMRTNRDITAIDIDATTITVSIVKNRLVRYDRSNLHRTSTQGLGHARATIRAFSPDGTTAFWAQGDNVRIAPYGFYDLTDGAITKRGTAIRGHEPAVVSKDRFAAFDPRLKMLMVGARDPRAQGITYTGDRALAIALHPDGRLFLATEQGAAIRQVGTEPFAYAVSLLARQGTALHVLDRGRFLHGGDAGQVRLVQVGPHPFEFNSDTIIHDGPRRTTPNRVDDYIHEASYLEPHPDGQRLMHLHPDELAVSVLPAGHRIFSLLPPEHDTWLWSTWHNDGNHLWTQSHDGLCTLQTLESPSARVCTLEHDGQDGAGLARHGDVLVSAWGCGHVLGHRLLDDSATQIWMRRLSNDAVGNVHAMLGDGRIAIGGAHGLRILAVEDPDESSTIALPAAPRGVAWHEGEGELAVWLHNGHLMTFRDNSAADNGEQDMQESWSLLMDIPLANRARGALQFFGDELYFNGPSTGILKLPTTSTGTGSSSP